MGKLVPFFVITDDKYFYNDMDNHVSMGVEGHAEVKY